MQILTTSGVTIEVNPSFSQENSDPKDGHYIFFYDVKISNQNPFPVQLLSREWLVFDSCNEYRVFEGDGVIGEQPVIGTGETFTYRSACNLFTPRGTMKGSYLMKATSNGELFSVRIPKFVMELPCLLN